MSPALLDQLPGWLLLPLTVMLLLGATEVGFRLGSLGHTSGAEADRKSHAGVVLGALLALLGLSLAFSFSIAEARFVERRRLVLQEANAIGTAYLRAEMLPPPQAEQSRELLRQYVDIRLVPRPEELRPALAASEDLHAALWSEAAGAAAQKPDPITSIFVQSLNQVIDLHEERVTVALYQRMPGPIFLTLYLIAFLAMASLGYTAGLARTRSWLPSVALIVAVSIVLLLIIDLDRPFQRVFQIDQSALEDVRETMSADELTRARDAGGAG